MEHAIPCSRTGTSSDWFSASKFSKSAFVPASIRSCQHSFLQIYFMDSRQAVQRRKSLFQGLEYSILTNMQDMLRQHKRYIDELRCAYEFTRKCYDLYVVVIRENVRPCGELERRHNAPTSNDNGRSDAK
ncbi:hypothetical protein ElyMa_000457300 [Elysia marginata]|uniref:Uncharacterized protein n=1 Tax=Elysia marginata TaxID=1093978 RepID=A0AAV4FQB2_9GAST|nr:hypothetical protein ElyMa_000457300 [Elysia marginata]